MASLKDVNTFKSGGRIYIDQDGLRSAEALLKGDTWVPIANEALQEGVDAVKDRMKKATPYLKKSKNKSRAKEGWVEVKQSTYHRIVKNAEKPLLPYLFGIPAHTIPVGEQGILSNIHGGFLKGWPLFVSKAAVNHPGVLKNAELARAWVSAGPAAAKDVTSAFINKAGNIQQRVAGGRFGGLY